MSNDELAQGIAARVLQRLAESERSIMWLHKKTGIKYKTLLNQLKRNPHTLSIANAVLIAGALDMPLSDLTAAA